MLTKEHLKIFQDNLSISNIVEFGRWVNSYTHGTEVFILHECTFTIFSSVGNLDFTLENSSPGNPYIFINTQSVYHPISWPKNWEMIEIGFSHMEIVYQRTKF